MFPDFDTAEEALVQPLDDPIPWTYKIDWTSKQLMKGLDGRHVKTTTYAEYLEEITKKILNTRRFQYSIYSDRVGVDYFEYMGLLPKSIPLPVVKREAEDALEAHSEIEHAEVADIHFEKDRVVFSVSIEGVRGKTKVEVDVWRR